MICLEHANEVRSLHGALGAGAAVGREDAEVVEPCTAVELGVDGVDEEWLLRVLLWVGDDLDGDEAGHELIWSGRAKAALRAPAEHDCVAVVPHLEDVEWDRGLAALALDELLAGGERWLAEGGGASSWAAVVDELEHGVGVVVEVLGEGGEDQGLVERFVDGSAEVLCDLVRVGTGHAGREGTLLNGRGLDWGCRGTKCQDGDGGGDETLHFACFA